MSVFGVAIPLVCSSIVEFVIRSFRQIPTQNSLEDVRHKFAIVSELKGS